MSKFRKKPVEIEAMLLDGTTAEMHAVYQWVERNTLGSFEPMAVIEGREPCPASGVSIDPRDGRLIISTLEGLHWANVGDWIIRGVQGEFYPCKPDIFEQTYESATETLADQGKPQITEEHRPQRLSAKLRADLIDFAANRIQAVWDDVGETDAETLAENVVSAQEFAWMSAQVPIVTDERVKAGARAIRYTTEHSGLEHVDWPDEFDAVDIARAVLEAALGKGGE